MPPLCRCIALLSLWLAAVAACDQPSDDSPPASDEASDTGTSADASGSTDADAPADHCAAACDDTDSPAGVALCHSCRCKAAFDDWLPPAEQLQCANGEPIVVYQAVTDDSGYTLEPAPPSAFRCTNPSLLTDSCRQGSKLGHLVHDDVSFYWICRDPYLEVDGTVIYEDMAIIGHNGRTGATCFWDDVDNVIHEDDTPSLDLEAASLTERQRWIETFEYTDGANCIRCHDHDPFLYTPHLQSTTWQTIANKSRPYHRVGLDGQARPTGVMHLVSPAAAACTGCHRVGNADTCEVFARDALGAFKHYPYEDAVHDAMDPGSPHWPLAYWMPGPTQPVDSFAQWDAMFGQAREHILSCCDDPGASGCEWAPVPAQ